MLFWIRVCYFKYYGYQYTTQEHRPTFRCDYGLSWTLATDRKKKRVEKKEKLCWNAVEAGWGGLPVLDVIVRQESFESFY